MPKLKVDRLGELNAYQIAGIAIVVSTTAALSVVFAIRHMLSDRTSDHESDQSTLLPASDGPESTSVPSHFSESLIIPGITESGREVSEHDAREGRSPEGA